MFQFTIIYYAGCGGHVISAYVVSEDWSAGNVLNFVLYVAHAVFFADVSGESAPCVQSELVKSLSRSALILVHSSARIRASLDVSSPMKCD